MTRTPTPARKAQAVGLAARLAVTEAAHLQYDPARSLAVGMALRAWTSGADHVEGWSGPDETNAVYLAAEAGLQRIRRETGQHVA